jgi:hypothetical protein
MRSRSYCPSHGRENHVKFCFVLSNEEKRKLAVLADDQGRSAAGVIRNIIQRAWQAFPEDPAPLGDAGDFRIARQAPYDREIYDEPAKCACGAVAVQWRKDTPVCAKPECLTKATFGGK